MQGASSYLPLAVDAITPVRSTQLTRMTPAAAPGYPAAITRSAPRVIVDWLPTPSEHFLVSAIALLIYVLTTRARHERRAPTAAIAWVLGLALIPYLMLPLYVLFGQRKLRPAITPHVGTVIEGPHWAAEVIESFGLEPPALCRVRLHADGKEARVALLETITRARQRLDISTFIIGDDALGENCGFRIELVGMDRLYHVVPP